MEVLIEFSMIDFRIVYVVVNKNIYTARLYRMHGNSLEAFLCDLLAEAFVMVNVWM